MDADIEDHRGQMKVACPDHIRDVVIERQCGIKGDSKNLQSLGYANGTECDGY